MGFVWPRVEHRANPHSCRGVFTSMANAMVFLDTILLFLRGMTALQSKANERTTTTSSKVVFEQEKGGQERRTIMESRNVGKMEEEWEDRNKEKKKQRTKIDFSVLRETHVAFCPIFVHPF